MKVYIYIIISLMFGVFINAQTIINQKLEFPINKIISVSVDGEIVKINNLPKEIEIIEEPLELNGKTLIDIKISEKWEGNKKFTLINSLDEFYNIEVSVNENLENTLFFITSNPINNEIDLSKNNIINKENNSKKITVNEDEVKIYKDDAKRINSILERTFSATKRRTNGIFLELFNVYARNNKLFIRLRIENQSAYDLDLNNPIFSIVEEESYTKKTTDEENINSIYNYNQDEKIVGVGKKIFKTFVFESFKIGKNNFFKISFSEESKKENIELYISNKIINNPTSLTYKNEKKENNK